MSERELDISLELDPDIQQLVQTEWEEDSMQRLYEFREVAKVPYEEL